MATAEDAPTDFIREIVREDVKNGKHKKIVTRFPPEPNGYLHIGHAKAFCLDFGLAEEFDGQCNLRFDDTNPDREDTEYVESIQEDLKWMGFDWGDGLYFASDYFDQLYNYAVELIQQGKAYVCDLSPQEIREYRGTVTEPGKNSPYRNRTVSENLDLFAQMKNGELPDGACTLRAKADMASPNMNMRDPVMYRIKHTSHHRTGDKWCIYPMYDWAHGQSDAIEQVTHSLCSIEFAEHRPLYDWYIQQLEIFPSRQIEFARLNITYTLTSKRMLTQLVERGLVNGWEDPRMPTLSGMRRRGVPPQAIKNFIWRVGMNRRDTTAEIDLFEFYIREHLNKVAPRVMGVIDPLKVVIENYPEDEEETFEAMINPEDPDTGTRPVPFSRELYIEREDFMEDPPRKFYRLAPGREVRLRAACYITCQEAIKDDDGNVIELRCTWDPESRGGTTPDKRRVRSTLHWVSAKHALKAEVRLFDRLFMTENPTRTEDGQDFTDNLNPNSLEVRPVCYVEPSMKGSEVGSVVQFERLGYFCVDTDSSDEKLVLNRTITLRDTWARMRGKK
ncbi:MAG: glutamine--tRNA ligase/YqeY domain fusion protein [Gemmatimonadota bacterium]|nr:glutamine--tRNA ligase/YqeY domain fusion protein [Gemmatimonadota bacterium]MYB58514.1 glutamine--tRNA ligase/YqeY domain fusion protein [Gemmatimonadota bacterium]MYD63128.1 glutamine--tRNA ligase/YqeY domain fusion protein [Gemmatimonadota bacterium]